MVERKQWVPIGTKTELFYDKNGESTDWITQSQTMIPLKLAWAWTIWKAQGQTIRGKMVIDLGETEKEHGLAYVALSCATKLSNIEDSYWIIDVYPSQ